MDSGSCSTDLPTPKPCKSEVFEKKNPQKPGDWDLKTEDLQNTCQIKPN